MLEGKISSSPRMTVGDSQKGDESGVVACAVEGTRKGDSQQPLTPPTAQCSQSVPSDDFEENPAFRASQAELGSSCSAVDERANEISNLHRILEMEGADGGKDNRQRSRFPTWMVPTDESGHEPRSQRRARTSNLQELYAHASRQAVVDVVAIVDKVLYSHVDHTRDECWTKFLLTDETRTWAPPVELFTRNSSSTAIPRAHRGDCIVLRGFAVCWNRNACPFLGSHAKSLGSALCIWNEFSGFTCTEPAFEPHDEEISMMRSLHTWWGLRST